MDLKTRVEDEMGESVKDFMHRKAKQGKTIRHCSAVMDVSPTTAHRWAHKHQVKFNANNPFKSWRLDDVQY